MEGEAHKALERAKVICQRWGKRLTPVRQSVLELLHSQRAPLKAYDILKRLQREGYPAHPPTAYRALEFLLRERLIHRLNSLNAYVACAHPQTSHSECYFLVCSSCGKCQESCSGNLKKAIRKMAKGSDFRVLVSSLEIQGLCSVCAKKRGRAAKAFGAAP